MQVNLAVISFVCAVLLALFIPIARVRQNVANLAIISWLLGVNVVHGINAVIWAGNVEPHVPVWCDIVTKLMLGATVALPGAFLSIARRLELISSIRPITKGPRASRSMLEFILCYIVPLFYMCLHLVVQDHRFDLVENYGCSASIHPSAVGLTLMWLPPILLCCASLFLCGASISHSFNFPSYAFSTHLEQRSPITSSNFIRRLTITIITNVVLFVIFLFSVFTISQFIPYTWSAAHVEFSTINIIRDADVARSIQIPWLGIPIISFVYMALVLAIGEETRDAFKWIRDHFGKIPKWHPRPLLLLPLYSAQTRSDMESRTQLSTPPPRPGLELRSGWDDMLETGSKKLWFWSSIRKSPSSQRAQSPVSTLVKFSSPPTSRASTPSPIPSATSPTVCGEDDAFIKSTLEYLGSPTAKTLGIAPSPLMIPTSPVLSPVSPPPAYVSPRKATYHDTSPASPTSVHSIHDMPPSPRHIPADVESVISSVFDASWPQPPPSTPKLTNYQDRIMKSRSTSSAGSTETGVNLRSTITTSHRHLRSAKRAPSVRRLLRTFNSEKVQDGRAPVIYNVVNEAA